MEDVFQYRVLRRGTMTGRSFGRVARGRLGLGAAGFVPRAAQQRHAPDAPSRCLSCTLNWARVMPGVGRLLTMDKFRGQIQIGFCYSEHLGPRFEAAGVALRLTTHDRYEFTSEARWPEDDYSVAVERGVRDGLRESGFDPDLGVSVVLEGVEYDRVSSSEHTFYVAAKCAAKSRAGIRR